MRFLARCALVLRRILHTDAFRREYLAFCTGVPPEAEGEISLTARFQDGSGDALSSGAVRVLRGGQSADHALKGGELRLAQLSRGEELTLILLDAQGAELGRTTVRFSTGAVIDASTDAAGTSFVTLKPDTASVDLVFTLRGDGALACALRL